jgi:hypothetical protein
VGVGGANFSDCKKRRLLYLFSFYLLDSPFKLGLGLAGSLVGVIVNLLVVVAVRTDSRYTVKKVSGILASDGKIANLFLQCNVFGTE